MAGRIPWQVHHKRPCPETTAQFEHRFGGAGIGFGRSLGLGYSMPHGTYDAVRYGDESEVEIVRHEAEVAWPIMATARLTRWSDKVRRVALIKTTLMALLEKVRERTPLSHQPDLDLGRGSKK